jgi:phosphoserine phosphatase RsbU/P
MTSPSKSAVEERRELPSADAFLLELADVVNTTLDLDTLLARVAEHIRKIIPYEIFAIMLLNEKTQELRIRFSVGHPQDVAERLRIKVPHGVTGQAVQRRGPVRVSDVLTETSYIEGTPGVRSELAVPLIIKNRVIGVIDIESAEPGAFNEEHERLLTLIASRIAIGIENARLYTRVARQAQQLTLLNEISRELTSILNLDQLLKRIGEMITRVIDYQMFSILLLDPKTNVLVHRFSLRFKMSINLKHDIPVGRGLVGYSAEKREAVLVPDVTKDPRYIQLNRETRAELCVPLIYKDEVIGVLDLEHTRRGYYTEEHVRTLTTLAAQIAIAIENARLYERIAMEERRLERDLSMAREVQMSLMPPCCPAMPSAEVGARFAPAREIGGDLYDFLAYSKTKQAIAVGDVSGKGAPAALYAALSSGILRSHAAAELAPAAMLAATNRSLQQRPIQANYLSLIYALWEAQTKTMRIANSGLPRPIYCHQGETQIVEAAGLPLGLFPEAEYDETTIHAQKGDVFVFFSDGIIDATNGRQEGFGRRRVEEVVARNCERSADEIAGAILDAVEEHSKDVQPFDDETVVVVKIVK